MRMMLAAVAMAGFCALLVQASPSVAQSSARCGNFYNQVTAAVSRSDRAALERLLGLPASQQCLPEAQTARSALARLAAPPPPLPPVVSPPVSPSVRPVSPPPPVRDVEADVFAAADTCAEMRDYQRRYPNGRFRSQAQAFVNSATCSPPPPPPPAVTGAAAALRAALAGEAIANRRFTECTDCPEMVALPGGTFTLGSPSSEQGRGSDEGPQLRVTVQPFAVSRFEVTRAQYAAFTRETGRAIVGNCDTANSAGSWEQQQSATWQAPGFDQTGDHPVVCVSWEDATAYVAWINGKVNGDPYRLLTESEWEYAARAGSTTRFWWGDGESDLCSYANGADQSARSRFSNWTVASCTDGYVFTAPVGFSGRENRFGLADMAGNVWEWTQDCYNSTYDLTPTNGAANTTGGCSNRVESAAVLGAAVRRAFARRSGSGSHHRAGATT